MKTFYTFLQNKTAFILTVILAATTISCGSYQNSSYYDNDGVYNSDRPKTQTENKYSEQNLEKSNQYAQQFRTMQEDYTYFTDVDNYQSQEAQDTVVTVYRNESDNNYAGWGNNSSDVTINYYNNNWGWNNWYSPYWGTGWNWGWNSWYGPSWGWGWNSWYGPGWGWGWNNWYGNGWGWNGYYGNNWGWNGYYGRDVVYNGGRRGGIGYRNPSSGRNNQYSGGRTNTPRPNFNGTRNNPRTQNSGTRPSVTPRNTPRENSSGNPRNNNYSTPRNNNNSSTPRTNSSTPRSNNYSTPRSSSGGSFGGSSSGGGGRSGGGGSRGGRG